MTLASVGSHVNCQKEGQHDTDLKLERKGTITLERNPLDGTGDGKEIACQTCKEKCSNEDACRDIDRKSHDPFSKVNGSTTSTGSLRYALHLHFLGKVCCLNFLSEWWSMHYFCEL